MNLREERLNRGRSVVAMADDVGVPVHVWRRAERGVRPQPENALQIASFFDVKVTDLWPITESEAA